MEYNSLTNKTIFDLTDDNDLLMRVAGAYFFNHVDEFVEACKNHPEDNYYYITELADLLHDNNLKSAAQEQFKNDVVAQFTE